MPILVLLMFLCCVSGAWAEESPTAAASLASPAPGAPSAGVVAPPAGAGATNALRPGAPVVAAPAPAEPSAEVFSPDAAARVDLYCLRLSYPRITGMMTDAAGQWLVFADGRRVLYAPAANDGQAASLRGDAWVGDVRTSMAEPYPLEPERPETPLGVSPGRWRSYDLLQTLYGTTAREVGRNLEQAHLLGQRLSLAHEAARAINRASAALAPQAVQNPHLKSLLKVDGGFTWRRIAGENRLSPHAFGIAFDISPGVATYWRWSKLRPHPLQKSYPQAIVKAFEDQGFIWGGKWHEYDLMHFEYRPEIICKARVLDGLERLPDAVSDPAPGAAVDAAPTALPQMPPKTTPAPLASPAPEQRVPEQRAPEQPAPLAP